MGLLVCIPSTDNADEGEGNDAYCGSTPVLIPEAAAGKAPAQTHRFNKPAGGWGVNRYFLGLQGSRGNSDVDQPDVAEKGSKGTGQTELGDSYAKMSRERDGGERRADGGGLITDRISGVQLVVLVALTAAGVITAVMRKQSTHQRVPQELNATVALAGEFVEEVRLPRSPLCTPDRQSPRQRIMPTTPEASLC